MKAVAISAFGGPEVVTRHSASIRQPGAGEVLVRVEAASVNPLDLKIIAGYMQAVFPVKLPYIPGSDFSGIVSSVGEQVTHLKPGDRVFGRSTPSAGGAFAQQLIATATELCLVPAAMSFEQAAALPTAFGTARQALFEVGKLKTGERVLVHAAAGGVGSMAVQLAHLAGAYVIATASAPNIERVKGLGADEVIDYRNQDFTTLRDIDLVLDPLGGSTLERSWSVLGEGGRIASLVAFDIESRDGHAGEAVFFASATPFLMDAVRLFSAGQLQILTDSMFDLDEARAALEKVATGHACGKVIIRTTN